MSFIDRFKSPESQEKKLAGLEIEQEIVNKQSEMAERQAIIEEFKKQYGPGWKKIFGVKGWVDLSTLRSLQKGGTGLGHLRGRQSLDHLRRGGQSLEHFRRI